MTIDECTKAIAKHLGITGRRGGWLYAPNGKPICQGWFAAAQIWHRRGWIVDRGEPFGCHINWRRVPAS